MRSLSRPGRTGLPPTTSRPAAGSVSPAALRIAQEADATISPDGWEADYSAPDFVAAAPGAGPVFFHAESDPAP